MLPLAGEPFSFDVTLGDDADASNTAIAPDGSVWNIDGSVLRRQTSTSSTRDRSRPRRRRRTCRSSATSPSWSTRPTGGPGSVTGRGRRIESDIDPSEFVTQQAGPAADCGWVGANDDLWCVVRATASTSRSRFPSLDIDGSDLLAIAGDAAALVRRGPAADRAFRLADRKRCSTTCRCSVDSDEVLEVSAGVDLVWVDEVDGDQVWAVNPWGVHVVDKNGADIFAVGEDGTVIDQGNVDESTTPSTDDDQSADVVQREPDDNGVDDPPVAVDDPVTARSGSSVTVQVTAQRLRPRWRGDRGRRRGGARPRDRRDRRRPRPSCTRPIPATSASTRSTTPSSTATAREDSASVVIELLPVDATNNPPIGGDDEAETGPGDAGGDRRVAERRRPGARCPAHRLVHPARTSSVAPTSVRSPKRSGSSGLPALRFVPAPGFEGTALFSYRPVDTLDGQGDDVEVRVEVATDSEANRPPFARARCGPGPS